MSIAIRIEIDRLAHPDWIARRTRTFGDSLCVAGFQIENIEHVRLAAAVSSGERDPSSIGREFREDFDARMRGQTNRCAAGCRRGPNVATISESYTVPVNVRKTQELCLSKNG